jgi:hypothetical protein
MAEEITSGLLRVGCSIRMIEGNIMIGCRKGDTGIIVSVFQNTFTGDFYYRCEMDSPDKVHTVILLPSEVEPISVTDFIQTSIRG